jgi:tRNA threonylcarbamoyladenosine biosynthesis protein TsaE
LGAGKTTLVRGFLRAAGVMEAVKSPTYTLVETYRAGAGAGSGASADGAGNVPPATFVHLDLYRLIEPSELENLGLRDWAMPGHVWLVEWPERGAGHLPPADLVVRLVGGEPTHVIEIEAESVSGEEWLSGLA